MPPPPPPCPDGWAAGPPDVVGVGAQRSGTTWWYGLLASHPGFWRAPDAPKEIHFFDHCVDDGVRPEDADAYARHFPRPPGGVSGEWTPRYMFDFWTPACLKACAPDARLLVLLRDPVERYRSGIATYGGGRRRRGQPSDPMAPGFQLARSRYHEQLERLLRYFPRDRVLVLQHERCIATPERELERTHRFAGLPPFTPAGASLREPVNASDPEDAPSLPPEVEAALRVALTPDLRRLAADFPEIDLGRWPSAAGLVA